MSDLIKDPLTKRIAFHRHQLALTGQEGTVLDKLLADCKAEIERLSAVGGPVVGIKGFKSPFFKNRQEFIRWMQTLCYLDGEGGDGSTPWFTKSEIKAVTEALCKTKHTAPPSAVGEPVGMKMTQEMFQKTDGKAGAFLWWKDVPYGAKLYTAPLSVDALIAELTQVLNTNYTPFTTLGMTGLYVRKGDIAAIIDKYRSAK